MEAEYIQSQKNAAPPNQNSESKSLCCRSKKHSGHSYLYAGFRENLGIRDFSHFWHFTEIFWDFVRKPRFSRFLSAMYGEKAFWRGDKGSLPDSNARFRGFLNLGTLSKVIRAVIWLQQISTERLKQEKETVENLNFVQLVAKV